MCRIKFEALGLAILGQRGPTNIMKQALLEHLQELIETTKARDAFEVEYELEKSRLMFSAEVQGFSNQAMRDSQITLLLEEKGLNRKAAELRTAARISYYKWASIKSIIDGKQEND